MKTKEIILMLGLTISIPIWAQNLPSPVLNYGSVKDSDGNIYKTIQIGNRTWMAENLRTTRFNDGTSIKNVTDSIEWGTTQSPGYCYFYNDPSFKISRGALYNLYTVLSDKNVCISGWHVPTKEEWSLLPCTHSEYPCPELRVVNWNGTNSTGFSARPSGVRQGLEFPAYYDGKDHDGTKPLGEFKGGGNFYWLTDSNYYFLNGYSDVAWVEWHFKPSLQDGYSIRCIKDKEDDELQNGLVAYYPFNGNANDESGNGNNGIVHGAMLTSDIRDNSLRAYSFNGIDNYIEIPHNPLINFGKSISFTLSMWVNSSVSGTYALLDKGVFDLSKDIDSVIYGMELLSGFPQFSFGQQYSIAQLGWNRSSISDGKWHLLTATADRNTNTLRFYLDGNLGSELILESIHDFTMSSSSSLRIGIDRRMWYPYNGKIDDVRIYDRVIKEEEIKALFWTYHPEDVYANLAYNKTAIQSSTQYGSIASLAVDGNTDGNWINGSVTHTLNEKNAWWEVDLGGVYNVSSIEIWNRTDACCISRLSDYYIIANEEPFNSKDLFNTLNQSGVWFRHETRYPDQTDIFMIDKPARFIRIQTADKSELNLSEVRVMGSLNLPHPINTNVALNKKTLQSSTHYGGTADKAVDGNKSGHWTERSISHTNYDLNAWWEVDLGSEYMINSIEIWNRTDDCCRERLSDFEALICPQPFISTNLQEVMQQSNVWHVRNESFPNPSLIINDLNRPGRYFRIQSHRSVELNIAEVIVNGTLVQSQTESFNIAYNKPVSQSSTKYGGIPERAVDGDTNGLWEDGSVTHTYYDKNAWWEVDLGGTYTVSQIEIWNRIDPCCKQRLTDFYVIGSTKPFVSKQLNISMNQAEVWHIFQSSYPDPSIIINKFPGLDRNNKAARYIRIQSAGSTELNFAEVRVIGKPTANTFKSTADSPQVYEEISGIYIYPVPFTEFINVRSEEIIVRIELYNALGELLIARECGDSSTTLNTTSLEPGYYVIRIKTNKGVKTFPVIKRRE